MMSSRTGSSFSQAVREMEASCLWKGAGEVGSVCAARKAVSSLMALDFQTGFAPRYKRAQHAVILGLVVQVGNDLKTRMRIRTVHACVDNSGEYYPHDSLKKPTQLHRTTKALTNQILTPMITSSDIPS